MRITLNEAIRKIAALALIAACSVMLQAQSKTSVPKQPVNWSLSLTTGGAPWEKKFVVELNHSGSLVVNEEDPHRTPNDSRSKRTVNLTLTEAHQIYEQVLKAFREFRFDQGQVDVADGTNLTLQLSANRKVLTMQLFHIGADDEYVEIAAVFSLINKHLPSEHRVY